MWVQNWLPSVDNANVGVIITQVVNAKAIIFASGSSNTASQPSPLIRQLPSAEIESRDSDSGCES